MVWKNNKLCEEFVETAKNKNKIALKKEKCFEKIPISAWHADKRVRDLTRNRANFSPRGLNCFR
jgi:hypothetical protein